MCVRPQFWTFSGCKHATISIGGISILRTFVAVFECFSIGEPQFTDILSHVIDMSFRRLIYFHKVTTPFPIPLVRKKERARKYGNENEIISYSCPTNAIYTN